MRALIVLILCSTFACAACPNGYPTISEEYNGSAAVLVGNVVGDRITPLSEDEYFFDGDTYTVIPVRVIKGRPASRIDLFSENSSGRFPMRVGREYLIFAYKDHGRLIVNNCGNSEPIHNAKNALAQVIAVAAHGSDSQAAFNLLRSANPKVSWVSSSAKIADFDCDGKADMVMLGSEEDKVVIGVVWASPKGPPQILTFPIGTSTQDGFSEQPKSIETFPLDCKTENGRALPGCTAVPACRALYIRDDDTDAFNFYWDSSKRSLRWWRQ
jgi:hypothetical protein